MRKTKEPKKAAGISDAAVQKRTGKTWDEWFTILDRAGARKMNHKEIVAILSKKHGIGPWWRQMVTVAYEQHRGLREKHQKPDGYSVSRSKTIAAPVSKAYDAWTGMKTRKRWLDDSTFELRKATPNKSLRLTWVDGKTTVEVNFYAKGPNKSQVAVQHNKLPNAKAGERMKAYWEGQLAKLQKVIE